MRNLFIATMVGLSLTTLAPETAAQEKEFLGTITREERTVSRVIRKAGCNPEWYSQVLVDSSIEPSEAERLPIGRRIYLESGACKREPPRTVSAMTRQLFGGAPGPRRESGAQADQETSELRVERSNLMQEISQHKTMEFKLFSEIMEMSDRIRLEQARTAPQSEIPYTDWGTVILAVVISIPAGAAIATLLGLTRKSNGGPAKFRDIPLEGNKYRFKLVGTKEASRNSDTFRGIYRHPDCGEDVVDEGDNLLNHIKKCPELHKPRVTVSRNLGK